MNQLLPHKPKPFTSPFSRRVCGNSARILTLMAATRGRSRHDRAVNSLRGRIVMATTLEELCLILRFKQREIKAMLSLDVDLKTWRRLSQIQILQMFNSSGLKGKLSVATKIRFQDALFAEHIVLERINNTTDKCSLAQNMKYHYYHQAEELDVTKDMCFASILPDPRISSANGFYARRIASYLGSGNNRPSAGIIFGDHCIQIGNFRIGCMPASRSDFVIGHKSQRKANKVFSRSGTLDRDRACPWEIPLGNRNKVNVGAYFIEIGKFRIGCYCLHFRNRYDTLAIEQKDEPYALKLWPSDGVTIHQKQPNRLWSKPLGEPKGVHFGGHCIEIGPFRIGLVNRSDGKEGFDPDMLVIASDSRRETDLFLPDGKYGSQWELREIVRREECYLWGRDLYLY